MVKVGNQVPTLSIVLPYTESYGGEAVELYNMTENTAQEWQALLINDLMAINDDGLWTHTKFGYAVSRRNGKTEVVTARELWGVFNGEHILHTAHLTETAHIAWERLKHRIESVGIVPKSTYKAYGK